MSRTCTRCQQAVPDGDLLCGCQVVTDPSADVIARLTAVTIDARPLKWPGAPRYCWKRYFRKGTRKVKRLSRRVRRARRKAGQLT